MMLIVEVEIVVELFTVRFKSAVKVGLEIVLLAALLLEKVVLRGAGVVDGSTIML
ncbi:20.8 kDa protein [Human adenovirus sp.]|nr:20.8 kDa protein [Human adenovirus 55]ARM35633.1 20.8 kDa protein [Human adenovirus sp.]AMB61069.1 E3 20.8 kDa protein [Human adenovirus 55]AMB61236.1 E3 20.8 kDa protein [Human adenovirus 55]AMB61271.1 E3 20.8 kDa protein [Human adenovirus 55]